MYLWVYTGGAVIYMVNNCDKTVILNMQFTVSNLKGCGFDLN